MVSALQDAILAEVPEEIERCQRRADGPVPDRDEHALFALDMQAQLQTFTAIS